MYTKKDMNIPHDFYYAKEVKMWINKISRDVALHQTNSSDAYDDCEIIKHCLVSAIENPQLREEVSEEFYILYDKIEKLKEYEKKSGNITPEEHQVLVEQYEDAWKQRNFLWRVLHQKLNPYKINLVGQDAWILENSIAMVRKKEKHGR